MGGGLIATPLYESKYGCNNLMLGLGILLFFVWFVLSIVILVDVFKQKKYLGCLGILTLPIFPFIWVTKWYKGNKLKIGIPLYLSAILSIVFLIISFKNAESEIKPMLDALKQKSHLETSIYSVGFSNNKSIYKVKCTSLIDTTFEYVNVSDMVLKYQEYYINPILKEYKQIVKNGNDPIIILAIDTPSGFFACFKIETPGVVTKAWHSSFDEIE